MNDQMLLILCVVGAVAIIGYWMSRMMIGKDDLKVRRRLQIKQDIEHPTRSAKEAATPLLQQISSAAAKPFMPKTREKQSALRKNLASAGIYSPNAIRVIVGAKVLLMALGLGGGYALGVYCDNMIMFLCVGALVGYVLPVFWLKQQIKKNRVEIGRSLPDTLDLMVVCV